MILAFGALLDGSSAYVVHRLAARGVPFLLLDPRQYGTAFDLEWELDGAAFSGRLRHGDAVIPLAEVRSAYVHNIWLPGCRPETDWALRSFLESAPILVANRPSASATNFSKPWQLQVIAEAGFEVPRTLVTDSPEDARAFFESCRRRAIYKSISARRSIVRRMSDGDLERLGRLAAGPVQFQEWVPGTDVRVHVMGRRMFATEIDTEAVDYRYSGREGVSRHMRGITLPDDIAERARKVARALGLVSAGVDLRRSLDGRWYCFEANPTPGFYFYEQYTGQRIGDALADLLAEGDTTLYA
jgi:glutathione synthase/RimK-type ligase-like ATP-grasp enzyme